MRRGARAPAGACVAALLAVAAAYDPMEPEDEDMPDIDDEVAVGGDPATEKQQEEKGAPDDDAASGGATAAAANAAVFQYMSTKELQGILLKRGIDAREEGLVEKAELVARVVESAAAAGSGAKPAAGQRRAASSSRRQSRAGSGRSGESARVVIKYCASWGYRKLYDDYARELLKNYPNLEISGETHLPAPPIQAVASVLQLTFWAGLVMGLFGGLNNIPAPLGPWLLENKGLGFMGLFLLNILAGQLLATGAFEIFVNEELIFSKMETGQVPQLKPLILKLDAKLGFTQ